MQLPAVAPGGSATASTQGRASSAPGGDLDAVSQKVAGQAELLKRFPKRLYPPVKAWPYSHFRC